MRTMAAEPQEAAKAAVQALIYRAALLLDAERFADWLALCAPDFTYRIQTYSPEIRKQMTWLQHDLKGLRTMIEMLPRHNTDHGQLSRHVSVYAVELEEGGAVATAISSFLCHRTMLDGINAHLDAGETQLFLVGKYYDRFRWDGGQPLFIDRTVFLDTRRLDKGSHYPI
jgi:methanesulfonate monooxygenase small subunit